MLLCLLWSSGSLASIITFGNQQVDRLDLAGVQSEAGFSYLATGAGWEVSDAVGNPPGALATFYSFEASRTGDHVDFFLGDRGLFDFVSVDIATVLEESPSRSDNVAFIGLSSGTEVDRFTVTGSSVAFQTVFADFRNPIDRLRVEIAGAGSDAMLLDNFNLVRVVPAPAPLPLIAIALACLAAFSARDREGIERH